MVNQDEVIRRESYFKLVAYHWAAINDRLRKIIGEENAPKTVANSIDENGYFVLTNDEELIGTQGIGLEKIVWADKQKEDLLKLLDDIYEEKIYEPEAVLNFEQTMLA